MPLFHENYALPALLGIVGLTLLYKSMAIIKDFERAVVFRLGRYQGVKGPGLIFLIPGIDQIQATPSLRIESTSLNAEETLTKDAVAVTIQAVVFWRVVKVEDAVLKVADYRTAVNNISISAIREAIGATNLDQLLSDRAALDERLRKNIDARTEEWGVEVQSVDIQDITISRDLMDAISKQAQAQQEKKARVTLAQAEREIAREIAAAAEIYAQTPTALHIRGMGLVYDIGMKGSTIIVPSDMTSSLTGASLALALSRTGTEQAPKNTPPDDGP